MASLTLLWPKSWHSCPLRNVPRLFRCRWTAGFFSWGVGSPVFVNCLFCSSLLLWADFSFACVPVFRAPADRGFPHCVCGCEMDRRCVFGWRSSWVGQILQLVFSFLSVAEVVLLEFTGSYWILVVCDATYRLLSWMQSWHSSLGSLTAVHTLTHDVNNTHNGWLPCDLNNVLTSLQIRD